MKECIKCSRTFQNRDWECPWCHFRPEMTDGIPAFAPDPKMEVEGLTRENFDRLYELESRNFWFRARNQLILWAMRTYFAPFDTFLEIGCGTGYVLSAINQAFPRARHVGSEISSFGLAYAAKRIGGAELFQTDARNIPFRDEFDVIGAFDVLEHIEDDEHVLRQMHKALKDGGGIILTVPQHKFLWSYIDDYSHHKRRYSARSLREKIERNGFRIVRTSSFVSVLLPFLFLSRARVPADGGSFDPTRELRISGWKNSLLEQALALERKLIGLGIDLPAGGSLLLIARKCSARETARAAFISF